jgi:hypothetical protein
MGAIWLLGLGMGCHSPDQESTDGPAAGPAPSDTADGPVGAEYVATVDEPRWTAADVADQLGTHLPSAVPDFTVLLDVYLWMMGSGDGGCPPSPTQLTAVDPEHGCTSSEGFWYYGVGTYHTHEAEDLTGWMLSGDFEMSDPTSAQLSCGGGVWVEQTDGGSVRLGTVLGSWRWTGAADSLSETISASLLIGHIGGVGAELPEQMRLSGGLTTAGGSWAFHDLVLQDSCVDKPVGRVDVYEERRGHWYQLSLEDDCSGCGEVRFGDGRSLGRACPDLSGLSAQLAASLGPR